MSTNIQDYVELLNAEQYVQVDKLRENARHGITPRVRGEVWMYLLSVLSSDKTSEITSIISLNSSYSALSSTLPPYLQSLITKTALEHHTRRFFNPTYAGLISSITTRPAPPSAIQPQQGDQLTSDILAPVSSHTQLQKKDTDGSTSAKDGYTNGSAGGGMFERRPEVPLGLKAATAGTSEVGGGEGRSMSPRHSRAYTRDSVRSEHTTASSTGSHHDHQSHSGLPDRDRFSSPQVNQGIRPHSAGMTVSGLPPPGQGNDENGPTTTLRSQVSRFLPPPPGSPPTRQGYLSTMIEVLGKYYNAQSGKMRYGFLQQYGVENSEADWVYLATPFICCLTRPIAIYLGFEKLIDKMRSFPPFPSQLASLLTLFRLAIPELFSYFEDEQVPYVKIVTSWLKTLLAREMWLGDVLRLWDSYLASEDTFALHCYVCVAVLATCKETLEELDGSEAKLMLLDLPPLDVDRLLQDAANLRVTHPLPVAVDADSP